MTSKEESSSQQWPPKGMVAVGDYAFDPEYAPALEELNRIEDFVFNEPGFYDMDETEQYQLVVAIGMHAAARDRLQPAESRDLWSDDIDIGAGLAVRALYTRGKNGVETKYSIIDDVDE